MPTFSFSEILILVLMALLFADKYVPAILSRFGIIKKVNGNGKDIAERMGKLELHFNEETTEGLKRIEDAIVRGFEKQEEKLEHINEGIIHIKARLNGKP